jgi:hypothetical protein
MGKISPEAKKKYFDKVKEYKRSVEKIVQHEKHLLEVIHKDDTGAQYKRLTLADENLNLVSYFTLLNALSVTLLGVKNEAFLNDARKCCYKSVIYLEDVVSPFVDVPFSEYEERLQMIDGFEDTKRFELVRKLGFAITSVENAFGEGTKWKWSFVELEGRFAAVAKNLLNLKTLVSGLDPRSDGYEARLAYVALVKRLLQQSADRYREKYELSTLRVDDFKKAITFLSALRRLHMILGETGEAEIVKKKAEIWNSKMDADEKKLEQQARMERLQRTRQT